MITINKGLSHVEIFLKLKWLRKQILGYIGTPMETQVNANYVHVKWESDGEDIISEREYKRAVAAGKQVELITQYNLTQPLPNEEEDEEQK